MKAFLARDLLESFEAQEMLGYKHSGFSVDISVCIAAHDRAGLERLLRYCARPAFALDGVEAAPPRITPARGPPLRDACNAQVAEGVDLAPGWDETAQPAPEFEVDQRISW